MQRRTFVKHLGLTAAASLAAPYLLPSGRLYAATGSRKVNHVVFCLFAGGVRRRESVEKAEGNLMPCLLEGNESISADIAHDIYAFPPPAGRPLQQMGTLFKNFRYSQGPTGHFYGHAAAITGRYTDTTFTRRRPPKYPTLFELYRKHTTPSPGGLNAWWVTYENSLYPILNYSTYPGYGPAYSANHLAPTALFTRQSGQVLGNMAEFHPEEAALVDQIRTFADSQFRPAGTAEAAAPTQQLQEVQARLQQFISQMYVEQLAGLHDDPWGVGHLSNDMANIFYAEQILRAFTPELLVVNMMDIDVGHFSFTRYCNSLRKADYAVGRLWNTIQQTPGLQDDTLLIVVPEVGRNIENNVHLDQNGRPACDHTTESSREMFALLVGPAGVVHQGKVVEQGGETIDVVATIAHVLGFESEISGFLPGRVLEEAFI